MSLPGADGLQRGRAFRPIAPSFPCSDNAAGFEHLFSSPPFWLGQGSKKYASSPESHPVLLPVLFPSVSLRESWAAKSVRECKRSKRGKREGGERLKKKKKRKTGGGRGGKGSMHARPHAEQRRVDSKKPLLCCAAAQRKRKINQKRMERGEVEGERSCSTSPLS